MPGRRPPMYTSTKMICYSYCQSFKVFYKYGAFEYLTVYVH
jgi:hypothetical protein